MITVVGSINMDIVCQTEVFPQQGETVLGQRFETIPGGKGANQAVAAARLGSAVTMIGAVGQILGYYKASSNQTTNFYGQILGTGDFAVALIFGEIKP